MKDIMLDTHKLTLHPERVSRFLKDEKIYPISLEASLSSACNHRCVFCALDYTGYKPGFMDKDVLLKALKAMASKGLKSVIYSGEGEPFLNKDAVCIINETKTIGLDVAVSSNGVLFDRKKAESCLGSITWIRFSISAGTKQTYSQIHKTKPEDFEKALCNIKEAVRIKRALGLSATIGTQLILIKENEKEVLELGKILKSIGVDYFSVKPYSQNPNSINKMGKELDYSELVELEERLHSISDDNFKIFYRAQAMENLYKGRGYSKCYGQHFFTHIDTEGNVVPCIMLVGNKEFCYGNIYDKDIEEIWENKDEVVEKIMSRGTEYCREICRLDPMNRYLDSLKNPGEHVNFI